MTVRINGESDDYEVYYPDVILIDKNGNFKEMALSDIKEGQCLVSRNSYYYSNGTTGYEDIDKIFYIEK